MSTTRALFYYLFAVERKVILKSVLITEKALFPEKQVLKKVKNRLISR